MNLDLRPRCKGCNKIPRSKTAKINQENTGYCSFHCSEMHRMRLNLDYVSSLRSEANPSPTTNESHD